MEGRVNMWCNKGSWSCWDPNFILRFWVFLWGKIISICSFLWFNRVQICHFSWNITFKVLNILGSTDIIDLNPVFFIFHGLNTNICTILLTKGKQKVFGKTSKTSNKLKVKVKKLLSKPTWQKQVEPHEISLCIPKWSKNKQQLKIEINTLLGKCSYFSK